MIDSSYQVYLIEVNSNPCLETNCPILSKLIPDFIEDTLQYFPFYPGFASTRCSLLL
jgi:tubulin--tyrosine ligase